MLITGGLSLDQDLIAATDGGVADPKGKSDVKVRSHADSNYVGAIGAALWGAFRHET